MPLDEAMEIPSGSLASGKLIERRARPVGVKGHQFPGSARFLERMVDAANRMNLDFVSASGWLLEDNVRGIKSTDCHRRTRREGPLPTFITT